MKLNYSELTLAQYVEGNDRPITIIGGVTGGWKCLITDTTHTTKQEALHAAGEALDAIGGHRAENAGRDLTPAEARSLFETL